MPTGEDNVFSQFPNSSDKEKLIEYFGLLNKNSRTIKKHPEGLIIDQSKKETLLLVSKGESELIKILNTFPFPNYRLIAHLSGNEIRTFCDEIDFGVLCKKAEKILVVGGISNTGYDTILETHSDKIITYRKITLDDGEETFQFKFGSLNKDKTFMIIKPSVDTGLIWHYRNAWGKIERYPKYVACVDMQNYINQFISPGHLGLYNPWDYYFKQPNDFALSDIYESSKVIIASHLSSMSKEKGREALSDNILLKEEKLLQTLFKNKEKILGVFLRGTDYYYAQWHFIPYDEHEAVHIAKQYMDHYGLKYVFLNTEDEVNYLTFKRYFGEKLIALDRNRFQRMKVLPHAQGRNKNFDGLIVGENYILETLLTSRTDGVLSSSGMSALLIKRWGEGYNQFFDMRLKKNLRGICGSNPLVVENHNKNYGNFVLSTKTSHEIRFDGTYIVMSGMFTKGELVYYSDVAPTMLNAHTNYSTELVSRQKDVFDVYAELYNDTERKASIRIDDRIKTDVFINNIRLYVKIKCDYSGDLIFGVNIEKGLFATNYEAPYFSEVEVPIKDIYGIYYCSEQLNSIDLKSGVMNVGGSLVKYNEEELERINNSVQYYGGYQLIRDNNHYYESIDHMRSVTKEIEQCIDYWPIELSERGLSRNYLIKCIVAYLNSPYKDAQRKAFDRCVPLADNLHLCNQVAKAYKDGRGTDRDYTKAAEWMRKSVDYDRKGASELFDILWAINTEDSLEEMIRVGTDAAINNDRACMIRVGRAYRDGKGVEKNLNVAAEWMRKTIAVDYTWAAELADVLEQINTPESISERVKLLEDASLSGNAACMVRMGRAYREGNGVTQDIGSAVKWFRMAVNKERKGASELFDILWAINTEDSLEEMIRVGTDAAINNDRACMVRMGRAYRFGKGVERDLYKSAEWMRKTIAVDYTWAAELADVLEQINTPESRTEMLILLKKAAKAGNKSCKERLSKYN